MGVPLQCSAILVREKVSKHMHAHTYRHTHALTHTFFNITLYECLLQGILEGCNSMCAGYLFQPDKQYDVTYDTGDKAIQCGRHVDIFKFWLMWKAKVSLLPHTHTHTQLKSTVLTT